MAQQHVEVASCLLAFDHHGRGCAVACGVGCAVHGGSGGSYFCDDRFCQPFPAIEQRNCRVADGTDKRVETAVAPAVNLLLGQLRAARVAGKHASPLDAAARGSALEVRRNVLLELVTRRFGCVAVEEERKLPVTVLGLAQRDPAYASDGCPVSRDIPPHRLLGKKPGMCQPDSQSRVRAQGRSVDREDDRSHRDGRGVRPLAP